MNTKNSKDEKPRTISPYDLMKFATDICNRENNPLIEKAKPAVVSLTSLVNSPAKANESSPQLKNVPGEKSDKLVKERK